MRASQERLEKSLKPSFLRPFHSAKAFEKDHSWLLITHLSQLSSGFIVPVRGQLLLVYPNTPLESDSILLHAIHHSPEDGPKPNQTSSLQSLPRNPSWLLLWARALSSWLPTFPCTKRITSSNCKPSILAEPHGYLCFLLPLSLPWTRLALRSSQRLVLAITPSLPRHQLHKE
jgi:hypothetical protein